jgi:hypothetical protein
VFKLEDDAGKRKIRMGILLGDPKIIKHALEYIKKTGRLDVGKYNG